VTQLKVVVDRDLCEVNGTCVLVAPAVFEVGDDDQLRVLTSQPSAAELPNVETAVRRCPKGALALLATDASDPSPK
jgi:ferredoxin